MNRFVFVLLPLLLFFFQKLSGQVDSSGYRVFSGKIMDDSLEYVLPSVHLWNESTRMGSISNGSGEFSIRVSNQDTLVFSAIGYFSQVIVVSSSLNQNAVVRLKSKKYDIDEVVVRRFRSYESFKYQVLHLDLPESDIAQLKDHLKITSIDAALKVDRERIIEEKLETGRIGYITPLGKGINHQKAFREKTNNLKRRQQVIDAKFNRELVGDITNLEGDELTEFIALCDFSEDYLYETDLYTIMEDLHAKYNEYQHLTDTIPSSIEQ